jgi:hypothetical protein
LWWRRVVRGARVFLHLTPPPPRSPTRDTSVVFLCNIAFGKLFVLCIIICALYLHFPFSSSLDSKINNHESSDDETGI